MSAISRRVVGQGLNCSVQLCQVRCAHQVKWKNEKIKPMIRRVFNEIMQPIPPQQSVQIIPNSCMDKKLKREQEGENPYEQFLIKQLKEQVDASQTVIVCHPMPLASYKLHFLKGAFIEKNIKLMRINNKHFKSVISGTTKQGLSPLLNSRNIVLMSPDFVVKEALNMLKKMPELVLLGGFAYDRVLNREDLQNVTKLPSKEMMLAEVCATLNAASVQMSSLLTSHQQILSTNLEQYRKTLEEEP